MYNFAEGPMRDQVLNSIDVRCASIDVRYPACESASVCVLGYIKCVRVCVCVSVHAARSYWSVRARAHTHAHT